MKTTWTNEPMSAITHLIGAALSVVGLVLLIVKGARAGSTIQVVTFAIFGSCMFLTYLMSTLYHFFSSEHHPRTKSLFQTLDHVAIYFLIAGTYTPVVLIALPQGWGWAIFGVVWALALLGTVIKTSQLHIPVWSSITLYLTMGWLVIVALVPLTKTLSPQAVFWLVLGGVLYTIGAVFFALEKRVPRTGMWGMHEMFHLCVMGGSFAHFFLLFKYI